MSEALERAYASNEQTPLETLEFIHEQFSPNNLRLVKANFDLTATNEDSQIHTYTASAFELKLPEISTDGRQDLIIQVDNVLGTVWQIINDVVNFNRANLNEEPHIKCIYRAYLPSNTSQPSGPIYIFNVLSSVVVNAAAQITASYSPLPNIPFPRKRYTTDRCPGLKYV